jgi:hypothetical protein
LLNIKRLAYEVTPVVSRWDGPGARAAATTAALPSAPARRRRAGISADALTKRIDQFLGSRGFKGLIPDQIGSDPDQTGSPHVRRRSTSFARTTCARRFRRGDSWFSPNAPS